jgi:hypothetical protein
MRIHAELNQVLRSQLGLLFAAARSAERIAVKWRVAVSFHLAGREADALNAERVVLRPGGKPKALV